YIMMGGNTIENKSNKENSINYELEYDIEGSQESQISLDEYIEIKYHLINTLRDFLLIGEYVSFIFNLDATTENIKPPKILEFIYNRKNYESIVAEMAVDYEINFKNDFIIIQNIIDTFFKKKRKTVKCYYKKQPMTIIGDPRLCKYILYLNDKEIVYVYNSTSYELIPYCKIPIPSNMLSTTGIENKVRIPHINILLRFLYISLYIVNLLKVSNKIDKAYAILRSRHILDTIITIKKISTFKPTLIKNERYAGINFPYEEYVKLIRKNQMKLYSDYFPYMYKMSHGNYRSLNQK
ncbi:MAG: hypothetical protein KIT69_06235, partial [Propionibacteriaceae bacterium]|nr:hypothetical protein [Propionibacteriaceae bacterium]